MNENPYADLFESLAEAFLGTPPGGGKKISDKAMGVRCPTCGTWHVTRVVCSGLTHHTVHEPTPCEFVPVVAPEDK